MTTTRDAFRLAPAKGRTYSDAAIRSVIVTAWEHGVGYWADADLIYDNDRQVIGLRLFEKDERTGKYVKTYRVGLAKVDRAMVEESLHPCGYHLSYPCDLSDGGADAILSDVIIQKAVFGDIIYG